MILNIWKSFGISENISTVFVHNKNLKKNRGNLLELFRQHIENKSINSIPDDFLQEDIITVEKHEEISLQSERIKAAELLLAAVEKSCSLKLLSILRSYKAGDLANRLQPQIAEIRNDVVKGIFFRFCIRLSNLFWP